MPTTTPTDPLLNHSTSTGPLTQLRQRRSKIIYACLFVAGLLPVLLNLSPFWQAAGIGLWFPGAGFLAAGGWWVLLTPLLLVLFVAALVAWLGTGMLLAPLLVWLGSAVLAGVAADTAIWTPAPWLAVALIALLQWRLGLKTRQRQQTQRQLQAERNAYLPAAMAAVKARAAAAQPAAARELSPAQLASLRYCIERGLQPLEDWTHFTKIDQFQPAAFRYQLNNLGYTLGLAQCHYTPNFHGYMSAAQRNIIEKFLRRENWDYWRLERLWGSFSLDFDPAAQDNIMLTGFYGINLGLYQSNTGDDRYSRPGALEFRLNASTAYPHDFHSITRSVVDNMQQGLFCLYPCEPNWIYTPCNFRGLTTIALHDRLNQRNDLNALLPNFMQQLDAEFTGPDGNLLTVMSYHTGFAIPAAFGNDSRALMMTPFAYEESVKAWAMVRHDVITSVDGRCDITLKGKGVDFGNYTTGHIATLAGMACAAAEMGDVDVYEAALRKLEADYPPSIKDGVAWYPASNGTRAVIAMAQLMQKDDWRNSVLKGPDATAHTGPLLEHADYPAVLVAKAISRDGSDLHLVLYGKGQQPLQLARLAPASPYQIVIGTHSATFSSDGDGRADINVTLNDRTEIIITPVPAATL